VDAGGPRRSDHGIGQRAISLWPEPVLGGERGVGVGVGVVKGRVDLKAPAERVDAALDGRQAHVDLLPRYAPDDSMTTEIVVTSSLTSPDRP
jgi:hypothetical protein